MTPIYLDYNATTPLDPAVLDAMLPWLKGGFGNPSSTHSLGRAALEPGSAGLSETQITVADVFELALGVKTGRGFLDGGDDE